MQPEIFSLLNINKRMHDTINILRKALLESGCSRPRSSRLLYFQYGPRTNSHGLVVVREVPVSRDDKAGGLMVSMKCCDTHTYRHVRATTAMTSPLLFPQGPLLYPPALRLGAMPIIIASISCRRTGVPGTPAVMIEERSAVAVVVGYFV